MKTVMICTLFTALVAEKIANQSTQGVANQQQTDYCDYVFYDADAVVEYLKSEYRAPNMSVISVTQNSETTLNTYNHKQQTMINYYNNNYNSLTDVRITSKCTGVCWANATTSLVEFYKYGGRLPLSTNSGRIFKTTINTARNNLYINALYAGGLHTGFQDDLAYDVLNAEGIKNKNCTNYKTDIYDRFVYQITAGNPVLFSIPEHEMCGCGYTSWKLTYKLDTGAGHSQYITTTFDFVIVNDTWYDGTNHSDRFSYYPKKKIVDGRTLQGVVFDMDFCLTEIQ